MNRFIFGTLLSLVFASGILEARAHERSEFYPQLIFCLDQAPDGMPYWEFLNSLTQLPVGELKLISSRTSADGKRVSAGNEKKIVVGMIPGLCRSTISNYIERPSKSCVIITSTCSPHDLGYRFEEVLQIIHAQERVDAEQKRVREEAEPVIQTKEKDSSWVNWSLKKIYPKSYSTLSVEEISAEEDVEIIPSVEKGL